MAFRRIFMLWRTSYSYALDSSEPISNSRSWWLWLCSLFFFITDCQAYELETIFNTGCSNEAICFSVFRPFVKSLIRIFILIFTYLKSSFLILLNLSSKNIRYFFEGISKSRWNLLALLFNSLNISSIF